MDIENQDQFDSDNLTDGERRRREWHRGEGFRPAHPIREMFDSHRQKSHRTGLEAENEPEDDEEP